MLKDHVSNQHTLKQFNRLEKRAKVAGLSVAKYISRLIRIEGKYNEITLARRSEG